MIPDNHRKFVDEHRFCVVGWGRGDRPPGQTPVFYATDGDDVLISVTESRQKTKALRKNPASSLCVLAEEMPFPYVTLFGTSTIETEGAAALMMKVIERMTGNPLDEAGQTGIRKRAADEGRVVLRFTAERSVSNLPS